MSEKVAGVGWRIALSLALGFFMAWLLRDLEPRQRAVGGVFTATVALWLTHALPLAVTALVGVAGLVLFGGTSEKEAFAAFGDPILLLFAGSFILAKAITESGLEQRISHRILCERWATRTRSRMLLSVGAISCLISLLVS